MIFKYIYKFSSFFLGVFIFADIGILINYLLKDSMKREISNINNAALIFFSLTILFLVLRFLIKKYLIKDTNS